MSRKVPTQKLNEFTKSLRKFGVKNILNQQVIANILEISTNDFITIQILEETGPITAGEIAKRTDLSTGTVTALIDRLEKGNFVKRIPDANDRRKVLISPIYNDKLAVQELYKNLNKDMLNLIQNYDDEIIDNIIDFLTNASNVL